MRKINELIWHCTATPEGREVTAKDIDRWHRKRGWNGIGYHKVIHLDGSVSEGRPASRTGAHVKGRNRNTIGYVYVGGLDKNRKAKDTRTEAQKRTMRRLTLEAIREYGLTKVSGHNQYAAKACPCFDAKSEYEDLLTFENGMPSRDPACLSRSRTMKGGAVGFLGGGAISVQNIQDAVEQAQEGADHLSSGTVIGITIGVVVLLGAVWTIYARWDDAGRPSLGEIFS